MNENNQLNVYNNGFEWVIAHSPADAVAMWGEFMGEPYKDHAEHFENPEKDWQLCDPENPFTFYLDTDQEVNRYIIPGYEVRLGDGDDGMEFLERTITAPFSAWAAHLGRCYLACTEDF